MLRTQTRTSPSALARAVLALLLALALAAPLTGCSTDDASDQQTAPTVSTAENAPEQQDEAGLAANNTTDQEAGVALSAEDIPEYTGDPATEIDGNDPAFTEEEEAAAPGTESYGALDGLGRCTAAFAVVGPETMPTEERGSIGAVKPSGWHLVKYDCVDGKYLYNRCHLIGYQLTGENANERNLITGTRWLNVEGMLPFENEVADYVEDTGNHVLYRVEPVFEGDDLVAQGVHMEARSVEDSGAGVSFNVFCFNVQPGVEIDYATGDSRLAAQPAQGSAEEAEYVLNTGSRKFHLPECPSVGDIKPANRQDCTASRDLLIEQGFEPCGRCNP